MMNKLISIIIPSYNMEAFLPKCLDSLLIYDLSLRQQIEVLVVNDGSKDNTSVIAHKYAENLPEIFRVIDKSNGNYGSCINVGLSEAKGVFVKILDADDTFDTEAFERFLMELQQSEKSNESIDLFLTDFLWVNEHGVQVKKTELSIPIAIKVNIADMNALPLLYMHSITYRKDKLLQMNYQQTEGISYTDNEWACYPIANMQSLKYVPINVYRYLIGREGQTVDPVVQAKSVWMKGKIGLRMASYCEKMCDSVPQTNRKYIADFCLMLLSKVYIAALIEYPTNEMNKYLIGFDCDLANVAPTIKNILMGTWLYSKRLHYNYGMSWNKNHNNNLLPLRLYRLCQRWCRR